MGWGLVGLSFVFAAYSFRLPISRAYVLKIVIVLVAGIISTHLLRLVIKHRNWMLLSLEKVIVRLSIGVVVATLFSTLITLGLNELTGVQDNRHDLDFF